MAQDHVSFGPFRLDLGQRQLSCGGVPVELGSRALDILCVLAAAKGEAVSKDELMSQVWRGVVVEENNIQVHISAMRKALNRVGGGQSYVVTVPGRGYRLIGAQTQSSAPGVRHEPMLPHKPSIAVLPFTNLSGDPEQAYFADGITEDIITELSRFSELFVIARNSSFQYKGKSPDIRQVGRELGVHYVLEGSIRRAGDRVRITAQLIDATTGAHRWADRYDRKLEVVFAVQDELARTIVSILAAHVNKAETERTLLKPAATWQAYDYYMRAANTLASFRSSLKVEELYEGRRFLENALSTDPNYARAHAELSRTYTTAFVNPLDADFLSEAALDRAYQSARRAVQLDPNLSQAHADLGYVLTYKRHNEAAIAEFERATALNPNYTDWRFALALVYGGEPAKAIVIVEAHMRVDPFYAPVAPGVLGFAYYMLQRYAEALPLLRECAVRAPNFRASHIWLAATFAQLGQLEEARAEAAEVLRIEPKFTIITTKRISLFKATVDAEHFSDGLRKAGLPEK